MFVSSLTIKFHNTYFKAGPDPKSPPEFQASEEMCSYAWTEGVTLSPSEWETGLNRREKGKDMWGDYIRPYVELMPRTGDERGRHVPTHFRE